jgi:hypothetical protein
VAVVVVEAQRTEVIVVAQLLEAVEQGFQEAQLQQHQGQQIPVVVEVVLEQTQFLQHRDLAAQVLSLSKFPMPERQPFQAVLRPRYRLRYQDLRFTP